MIFFWKALLRFYSYILLFLILQRVKYKRAMFYISQYAQLVEALQEMKRCNPDVNWLTISDQDRVPLKRYLGDDSFQKV